MVGPGAAAGAGAPAAAVVEGVAPAVAGGLAPERPGVGKLAAVVVGVASDAVVAAGLAFMPEKRDAGVGAGAVADVEAGAVVAAPPKKPPVLGVGAAAPPPPKTEGAAVVAAAAAGPEEAGALGAFPVAAAVVVGAGSGFEAVTPPKSPPVGAGAVGFGAPNKFPGAGCELAGAAVVAAGVVVPKRLPEAPEGLFAPPKRDGVCALVFPAGVPAGVVDEGKLNMLPAGLFGAGVVEPRVGAAALVPVGLFVPAKALPDAAGVSGLFGVGKALLVGVELLGF